LGIRMRDLAEESRDADARLGARVDSLVSADGELIALMKAANSLAASR